MLSYLEYREKGQRMLYKMHTLYPGGVRWGQKIDELRAKMGFIAGLSDSCSSATIKLYEAEKKKILEKLGRFERTELYGNEKRCPEKHFELLDAILHLLHKFGGSLYGEQWRILQLEVTPFYRSMEEAHLKYVVQQTLRQAQNRSSTDLVTADSDSDSDSEWNSSDCDSRRNAPRKGRTTVEPDIVSRQVHLAPDSGTKTTGKKAGKLSAAQACVGPTTRDVYKDWPPKTLTDTLNPEEEIQLYPSELPSPDLRPSNRAPSVPSSNTRGEWDILKERLQRSRMKIRHEGTEEIIPLKGVKTTPALVGKVKAVIQRWGTQAEELVFGFSIGGGHQLKSRLTLEYGLDIEIQDFWEEHMLPRGTSQAADLGTGKWYEFECAIICEGEDTTMF